jgi:hypothetical protein
MAVSLKENNCFFCYGSNPCPTNAFIFEENELTMHIKPIIHTSTAMFSPKTFLLEFYEQNEMYRRAKSKMLKYYRPLQVDKTWAIIKII